MTTQAHSCVASGLLSDMLVFRPLVLSISAMKSPLPVATAATTLLSSLPACCVALALMTCSIALPVAAAEPQVTVLKAVTTLPGPRYTWVEMPQVQAVETDPRVQDAQFRARLQAALDKALQAKGYRRAEQGERADFVVGYRVGVRDVEETTVRESTPSPTPQTGIQCGSGGCSQIVSIGNEGTPVVKFDTVSRTEGGLLIEVLEPGTIRVLWRALNRGTVKRDKASQDRLDGVARDTLAQLPAAGQ